ncbi:MAG: L-threonylcarbamoyladenylate synthase [Paracoccaceae bacterium]|nr:L-threonylcarbamoyladenylate synthase [Paracoccaceae bacterium]
MSATILLQPDTAGIASAADLLRRGKLVAFPTETVYGLGADAMQDRAVAAIYAAKNRPPSNPLILHVGSRQAAEALAVFSPEAVMLAEAFWPGPLTLVLPLRPTAGVSKLAVPSGRLVALRVPDQPVAAALITAAGRPLAAPSANPSGRVSPTAAAHVLSGLGGRIDAIVDGGPCAIGLESTIVEPGDPPRLLRPGGLPAREIEPLLGRPLAGPEDRGAPVAPGQLASHYAPSVDLRLDAGAPRAGESYLGFGPGAATLNLSEGGDIREAAQNLFGHLHALDAMGRPIAVAPIPDTGFGRAINDRLRRAAAPRG